MDGAATDRIRKVLAVLPLIPVIAIAIVVIIALTPTVWLTVGQGDGASTELNGLTLEAEIPIVIDSNMPYAIRDLSFDITLVDDERGSSVTVFGSEPTTVPAGSEETLVLRTSAFAPTVFLVLGDLIEREGSVLTFDMTAECSYLLGLAHFRLDAEISVPLAAEDTTVSYETVENSEDSFVALISGLSPSLIPEDTVMTVTGGGSSITLTLGSSGNDLTIAITSDGDLDQTIDVIRGSDDKEVTGTDMDPSPGQVDTLLDVIGFVRGYL